MLNNNLHKMQVAWGRMPWSRVATLTGGIHASPRFDVLLEQLKMGSESFTRAD